MQYPMHGLMILRPSRGGHGVYRYDAGCGLRTGNWTWRIWELTELSIYSQPGEP